MISSVQSLFSATSDLFRLKILAGRGGLQNPVSWMYYTEDISTVEFIRGGELIITTGLEIERLRKNTENKNDGNNDEDMENYLFSLVTKLSEIGASGLILNIGKYIINISDKILILCDNLNFPLLTMPWEVHIIDIMQDYGKRILEAHEKTLTIEKALFNAIFHPKDFELSSISDSDFLKSANGFFLVLLEFPADFAKKNSDEISRYMEFNFSTKIKILPDEYAMVLHEGKACYVVKSTDSKKSEKAKKVALAAGSDKFLNGARISVSGVCQNILDLPKEYEHAKLALCFCGAENRFSDYDNLGIFQLFGEIKDRKVLEKFYDDTLGALNSMGKEKLSDYLHTLRSYLSSNGSVHKTAEETFAHRNTVNYRIKRICEILGVNLLQDGKARYKIQTALYVKDLLDRGV